MALAIKEVVVVDRDIRAEAPLLRLRPHPFRPHPHPRRSNPRPLRVHPTMKEYANSDIELYDTSRRYHCIMIVLGSLLLGCKMGGGT